MISSIACYILLQNPPLGGKDEFAKTNSEKNYLILGLAQNWALIVISVNTIMIKYYKITFNASLKLSLEPNFF